MGFRFTLGKFKKLLPPPPKPTFIKKTLNRKSLFKCGGCNNTFETTLYKVRVGHTKSCGCHNKRALLYNKRTHGHSIYNKQKPSKVYKTWLGMNERCYNTNQKHYSRYGGRGIKVCKHWQKFENFLADMGEPPTKKHSIERIDNNKDYSKSNCKWALHQEQVNNRECTLTIKHKGMIIPLSNFYYQNDSNVCYSTFRYRISRGWPVFKALNKKSIRA